MSNGTFSTYWGGTKFHKGITFMNSTHKHQWMRCIYIDDLLIRILRTQVWGVWVVPWFAHFGALNHKSIYRECWNWRHSSYLTVIICFKLLLTTCFSFWILFWKSRFLIPSFKLCQTWVALHRLITLCVGWVQPLWRYWNFRFVTSVMSLHRFEFVLP